MKRNIWFSPLSCGRGNKKQQPASISHDDTGTLSIVGWLLEEKYHSLQRYCLHATVSIGFYFMRQVVMNI